VNMKFWLLMRRKPIWFEMRVRHMTPETITVREQGFTARKASAAMRTPCGHDQQVSKESFLECMTAV
jgi:hypothetical protein